MAFETASFTASALSSTPATSAPLFDFDPVKVDISLKSADGVIEIVKDGIATDYSEDEATKVLSADAVTADIDVHNGVFEATAWGCDLTHDYVTINADYRS